MWTSTKKTLMGRNMEKTKHLQRPQHQSRVSLVDDRPLAGFVREDDDVDVSFILTVSELAAFLESKKQELDAVDRRLTDVSYPYRVETRRKALASMERAFRNFHDEKYETLNDLYFSLARERRGSYRRVYADALRPYYLGSAFAQRALEKPFGYPGDYELIRMLLEPERDFDELPLFDQLMSRFILSIDPCTAHRNRIARLGATLQRLSRKRPGGTFSFASIGCGPALELEYLLHEASPWRGVLVDMDYRALAWCRQRFDGDARRAGGSLHYLQCNVKRMRTEDALQGTHDFIYCAGLLDYLPDSLCIDLLSYLYGKLNDGGLLLFTNVTGNRYYFLVEALSDWFLIYRTGDQVQSLCRFTDLKRVSINAESCRANLIVEIKK